jgi:HK97 family phage prohead protease
MTAPTDNLVRASHDAGTLELRADTNGSSSGREMFGHFAVFNQWTEIDSWYEGKFLERIAPGAFTDTLRDDADRIRIMYNHGRDPQIGDKPIAAPDTLREDQTGLYYEAELFDEPYATQLLPALRTGQLGASFRFSVVQEQWVEPSKATDHNPGKLPERTVQACNLFEGGPCPWGAYPQATAGVRSGTDQFLESFLHDPRFVAAFTERAGLTVVEKIFASLPDDVRSEAANTPAPDGSTVTATHTSAKLAVERARNLLRTPHH